MNSCLKNLIGVAGCKEPYPLVYINSLPGISIKSLDMIANEDQITYLGVIDNIIERAVMRIEIDLFSVSGVRFSVPAENYCVGRIQEPLTLVQSAPGLQGVLFNFKQSKYLVINVLSLFFRSPVDQTLKFYIIDLVTNEIYDVIQANLLQGENEIIVNKRYFPRRHSNQLFIAYEGNDSDYYSTKSEECYDDCSCFTSNCHIDPCGNKTLGYKNKKTDETYGISVKWLEECSIERFICENSMFFRNVILYAAGIEYVLEVMGSSRLNRFTQTKNEDLNKLMLIYESYYKKALQSVVKNLDFCDNCCFDCKDTIQYTYASP
jgi:hypothetical protein